MNGGLIDPDSEKGRKLERRGDLSTIESEARMFTISWKLWVLAVLALIIGAIVAVTGLAMVAGIKITNIDRRWDWIRNWGGSVEKKIEREDRIDPERKRRIKIFREDHQYGTDPRSSSDSDSQTTSVRRALQRARVIC